MRIVVPSSRHTFVDGLQGAVTGLPLLDGLVGGTGCGTP
jgi:hypothetical protein